MDSWIPGHNLRTDLIRQPDILDVNLTTKFFIFHNDPLELLFQASFLSMQCYNFGVTCSERNQYEECVSWLKNSFDIGRLEGTNSNEIQVGYRYDKTLC